MTRREREILAGEAHFDAALKWAAVAAQAGKVETGASLLVQALDGMRKRFGCDAAVETVRHGAIGAVLVKGPSPKRIASRAARRVRMEAPTGVGVTDWCPLEKGDVVVRLRRVS